MSPEAIKILEQSTGSNVSDVGCNGSFLDRSPEAEKQKHTKLLGLHQDKSFCAAKETVNKPKTGRERMFTNDASNNALVSKIHKEITVNTKKTNNPIRKWAEDRYRQFSEEDMQMAYGHKKRCCTSLIIM